MTTGVHPVPLTEWSWQWHHHQPTEDESATFAPHRSAQAKIAAFHTAFGQLETARASDQWSALLQIATIDLGSARTIEPHLDALTMLVEAGHQPPDPDSSWGVYAAETVNKKLEASGTVKMHLTGEKSWCSLAGELTNAIVTAWVGDQRQAFAIPLTHPSVTVVPQPWDSTGLREIPSGPIRCAATPAEPVGEPGWYLQRSGFWWGAIRVAACWLGGAIGMARRAANRHAGRPQPEPNRNQLLGQLDAHIYTGVTALQYAATAADRRAELSAAEVRRLALRVRNSIYRACQAIQPLSRELAGPELLTGDPQFNKADADLTVYLSQHHGGRDEADLGQLILEEGP